MESIAHWIDGRPTTLESERRADVFDPAKGQVTRQVPLASRGDADAAVAAAVRAFPEWRNTSITRRTRVLFRFRDLVDQHVEELAHLVTAEHGKTLADARGEVRRGLEVVEFACGIPHLLKGEYSELVSSDVDTYGIRQPLGAVAGVSPFNFPVMVPMWMFPVAIASGNTFVLKPSERDPSVSLRLAELWQDAGLPNGVFNVLHGDAEAVQALVHSPDVRAVSFVGSTAVARDIYEAGAVAGKRVQALGGAKNHMVVLPDAELDIAADAAVSAAYGSAGQRCMAVSVLVSVGDVAERIRPLLEDRMTSLRVGPGVEETSDLGPLITAAHRDRVAGYLQAGIDEGAELAVDGRKHPIDADPGGFWLGPSLFDHVTPEMKIYRDEIFGPVLAIVRVETLAEAIALINANPYGNGTAVFTNDGGAARTFRLDVQVGMVGVNVPIPVPPAFHSFGGWNQSLFGDTHVHGPEGVRFFTQAKVVTTRWPKAAPGPLSLGFPSSD